jgi:hypothetical protein
MPGLIAVACLFLSNQAKPDPNFIREASYPAGSIKKDTVSPAGYTESANLPFQFKNRRIMIKALYAHLSETDTGLKVELWNSTDKDEWLSARDESLVGWFEAKDGKDWKPIEYLPISKNANSLHRIVLPSGYELDYEKSLPSGNWRTFVRWVVVHDKKVLASNMILISIPKTMVSLSPAMSGQYEVVKKDFPLLVKKK